MAKSQFGYDWPLTVRQPKGKSLQLQALTMIDQATRWFEIKDVAKIDSDCCSQAFDDTWLCRYPRPQYLGFDGGKEFKVSFDEMREYYGIVFAWLRAPQFCVVGNFIPT